MHSIGNCIKLTHADLGATHAEQAAQRFAALDDAAHQGQARRVLAGVRLAQRQG